MDEVIEIEGIDCTVEEVIEYCHTSEIVPIPRKKNEEFRYRAGLTINQMIDYIKSLDKKFFLKKIDDVDPKHKGKLYIFKRLIADTYWCYIKIKINRTERGSIVIVISFHDDE